MTLTLPRLLPLLLLAAFLLPKATFSQTPPLAASPTCLPGGAGPESGALAGLAQPLEAPWELLALVEIPSGGSVKYELHAGSGRMEVDRFLSMPVTYPANYGVLPCTLAEDGDALDVMILTREPLAPGALIRVRPVGLLRMLDRGEEDHKLLAVPLTSVDPEFGGVRDLDHLPDETLARIEAFFRVYKELPDPEVEVVVGPWEGLEEAIGAVRAAMDRAK
jgi:inorganic pyrophosphatase